jgi:hypothetical protein
MKFTALVTIGAVSSVAYAQSSKKSAPDGCKESYDGKFSVGVLKAGSAKRQSACGGDSALVLTLKDGVLTDSQGRVGSIASNYQLQFDGPPQDNAIATSGFSACSDGKLALGSNTTFYQCLSGDFFNLYDRDWAEQCEPITIAINPCGSGGSGGGSVGQIPDGQPQASQIPDGQVQAPTGLPATQIGDGQVQAPTGAPVTQIPDGQIQAPSAPVGAPISQIPDGQIQAPSAPAGNPISQIPDGQIQAPTGSPPPPPPPPAPTGAPVTQIPDGQVQAPTEAPAPPAGNPISQIPDGQVQAPTGTPPPVSFPRPQPTTLLPVPPPPATTPAPSPIPTGAASQMAPHAALAVAAFGAVLFL